MRLDHFGVKFDDALQLDDGQVFAVMQRVLQRLIVFFDALTHIAQSAGVPFRFFQQTDRRVVVRLDLPAQFPLDQRLGSLSELIENKPQKIPGLSIPLVQFQCA